MNLEETLNVLRQNPYLGALSDADRTALAAALVPESYEDGEVVIYEGARADGLFVILSGELEVVSDEPGDVVELNRLGEGALVGLLALLDSSRRAASCVAVGPVRVGHLPLSAYNMLQGRHNRIAHAFQRALARQLADDFRSSSAKVRRALDAGEV
jgi:CRP-like cAMP-binding protein